MFGWFRARKPEPVVELPPPVPVPEEPLRCLPREEVAYHVVESLRATDTRWILAKDLDLVVTAWCSENCVQPPHPTRVREAVKSVPGVRYVRQRLALDERFAPIRRRLQDLGMNDDRARLYEICPPLIRSRTSPTAVPDMDRAAARQGWDRGGPAGPVVGQQVGQVVGQGKRKVA